MQKITIRIPDELLDRLEKGKGSHENLSSFCRLLFEKGLRMCEIEQAAIKKIIGASNDK